MPEYGEFEFVNGAVANRLQAENERLREVADAAMAVMELEGGADLIPIDVDGSPMGPWQRLKVALKESLAVEMGPAHG